MYCFICSMFLKWLCVLGLVVLTSGAYSATVASNTSKVDVGLYLNNVPSISLKEKKFQVDFNIWFRWKGDEINPMESFRIFNGSIDAKEGLVKKSINGVNYASQRVQATIYRKFDVDRYPLDNHTLKIQIEDSTPDATFEFVVDADNSNISPRITIPGWTVGKFNQYSSTTIYKTNHGDLSLGNDAEAKIPRYTFTVDLNRPGYGFFFKYFSVLFLSSALTLLAFWISSGQIDTRYYLVTSAFFLAVITGGSLASTLPETESFGLGDQLYHLSMGLIFLTAALVIHQSKIHEVDPARANRHSKVWGWGLTVIYPILATWIVIKG